MEFLLRVIFKHPRTVLGVSALLTLGMLLLALLPSLFPGAFSPLNGLKVDTDPENMLSEDEPERVMHRESRKEFSLYDQIIVGVINDAHEYGVFNPDTLKNIYELTEYAKQLDGVIGPEIIAPSTIDNIEQSGLGAVSFSWMMNRPPETMEGAISIRDAMKRLPLMDGSVLSNDGRSLMIYIPIEQKDFSYRVSNALLKFTETLESSGEVYHITGLPVANDTFGVQMFVQMAISAPVAIVLIFLLLWLFFKRFSVILSPILIAIMSVIITMGALIASGNTVHIMSSMIPIFIMPIAVLDAVHILSEFYDKYPEYKDKKKTVKVVMAELWRPMLFTSLTTTAGFGSLALTPIPPVQVFGLFVALGVLVAWLLTILFIPAYLILIPERYLTGYGHKRNPSEDELSSGWMIKLATFIGTHPRKIIGVVVLMVMVAAIGITKIVINDNPIKWFEPDHRIRVADQILNQKFSGTYPAYLRFESDAKDSFKDPELLNWVKDFEAYMSEHENVGKTSSINGIIQTVYREMMEGDEAYYRIPHSAPAVAQTILTYEGSHRPDDVYHFVTPDFKTATVWFQLNSGDNQETSGIVAHASEYLLQNPAPVNLSADWFGLSYINVIWQDKMVTGMLKSLLSSLVIVFILMVILFRSFTWGLLTIIPLALTILFIYGIIGWVGKTYDMPVAVLSSLSLGLSVDYAIHLVARSQALRKRHENWIQTLPSLFGEPARAILRNIIVVGVGFTPLLLAPLVPYQTVGFFISSILVIAGFSSLLLLPALIRVFETTLFKSK